MTRPAVFTTSTIGLILAAMVAGTLPAGVAAAADPAIATVRAAAAAPSSPASGPAPATDRITYYVVMDRPERTARRALRAVSDPTSPRYRRFPGRPEIRQRFGATVGDVRRVRQAAAAAGLRASLDATGVFMRLRGTVAAMQSFTGQQVDRQVVSQQVTSDQQVRLAVYTSNSTTLPDSVAGAARELVPFFVRSATRPLVTATTRPVQPNRGTYVGGCTEAERQNTYSFDQLARAYGVDRLPDDRATGRASHLAIIASGNGYSSVALRRAARCFDVPGRHFHRVLVDGMVNRLAEGDEGNLDTQVAQAVMPRGSRITVIESPTLAGSYFLAWAQAFALPRLPAAVTQSYGLCEPLLDQESLLPPMRRLLDAVLVRLGLAGTSAQSSSGDNGSTDCVEQDPSMTTTTAIDYPSSSPFITAVGGSRLVLHPDNTRRSEWVWRDVNRTGVINGVVQPVPTSGGGGGVSELYPRPWWQRQAGAPQRGRTTPDLAMHGSFGPGWPVYLTGAVSQNAGLGPAGFYAIAGTSAATPYFSATMAVIAAAATRAGEPPYGHLAPTLYRLQRSAPQSLYDITRGDNDLYGVGCCSARPGYDLASGLGSPNVDRLAAALPPVGGTGRPGRG